MWERVIGIIKNSLKKVIGTALLTRNELTTLVTQIEAKRNDRPLTHVSEELGDPIPLAHLCWTIDGLPTPNRTQVTSSLSAHLLPTPNGTQVTSSLSAHLLPTPNGTQVTSSLSVHLFPTPNGTQVTSSLSAHLLPTPNEHVVRQLWWGRYSGGDADKQRWWDRYSYGEADTEVARWVQCGDAGKQWWWDRYSHGEADTAVVTQVEWWWDRYGDVEAGEIMMR